MHKDRVQEWLSKGAQPSEQAASLLRSLDISMHRASPPRKKPAVTAAPAAGKKLARKAAAPRKLSERKTEKRAAKKSAKGKAAKAS